MVPKGFSDVLDRKTARRTTNLLGVFFSRTDKPMDSLSAEDVLLDVSSEDIYTIDICFEAKCGRGVFEERH